MIPERVLQLVINQSFISVVIKKRVGELSDLDALVNWFVGEIMPRLAGGN